jgi:TRAP-type C4-dicarboxylate transport system permease small subunit
MSVERLIDRVVRVVEYGAAVFLALVTALTFVSVISRYVFSAPIPDSYDFTRLTICIAIFWGIACACWRGEHIQVDLLWSALGPRGRLLIDVTATLVLFFSMAVLCWVVIARLVVIMRSGMITGDLLLPTWPFFTAATFGLLLAVLVIPAYLYRLVRRRQ